MERLKRHIDKAGIIGVFFSHLCCIGLGTRIGSIVPAFAPFLMKHKIFMPFLIISLSVSTLSIFFSYLKHKNILPFLISIISSALIIVFSFVMRVEVLFYTGLFGLICASIYNMVYSKKCKNRGSNYTKDSICSEGV